MSCVLAVASAMAQDYTSYILNPSFENGLDGWTITNLVTQTNSSFKTNDGKSLKDGNTYVEKWVAKGGAAGTASAMQSVTGLPLGKYTLTAAAQNLDQNNVTKACTGVTIYAKSTTTKTVVTVPGDYSVNFDVTSSVAATKIGFNAASASGNWLALDNFRLTKVGDIATSTMITHLKSRISSANIALSKKAAKDVKEALESAIAKAGTMTEENTPDEINEVITNLNDAVNAVNASATELTNLSKLIKTAEGYQGQPMQKEISDRLDAAIETSGTVGTESTAKEVKASIDELTEVNSLAYYGIQAYENLAKAITNAEEVYDPSFNGAEEYNNFLTQLKGKYDARSLSTPSAKDYTARIPDIILGFRIENPTPGTGAPVKVTLTNHYVPTGATEALMRAEFEGDNVLEKGICWSTEHNPTVVDNRTKQFWTLNGNIYHATGLEPATVYYLRPYIISNGYEVAYGDEVKIVTHPQGTCRGTWDEGAPTEAANTRCREAINQTIDYFNEWTGIAGFTLSGHYGASTPTADCSYGGWMRIGPNSGNQAIGTVIHETGHGVGVGTRKIAYGYSTGCYDDTNLHNWKWYGREANKVYSFLENKEADPYNSDFCMVGDGTHAWGASASYDWFVNGADKDKHLPLQYAGGCILLYGMFVDGLCPTDAYANGLPAYTYNFDEKKTYYIMCKNEKAGLNTGLLTAYTLPSTGTLSLKVREAMTEGGSVTAADEWKLSYNAKTGYYQFRNVATGRYLSCASSITLKNVVNPTSAESIQIMPDRTDVTIGEKGDFKTHGYWFTWNNSGNRAMQATNMSNGLCNVTGQAFNFSDTATNQQFIIISEDEMMQYYPSYAPKDVKGDVDGNGIVNKDDITAIVNVICGDASNNKADVNNDGKVDINDVTSVVGIICVK